MKPQSPLVRPLQREVLRASRQRARAQYRSQKRVQVRPAPGGKPAMAAAQSMLPWLPMELESPLLQLGLELRPVGTPGLKGNRAAGEVAGSGRVTGSLDMGLELLSVGHLDGGRHKAVVLVDPREHRALKGRLSLARVLSESLTRAENESPFPRRGHGVDRGVAEAQALGGLAAQMNQETGVRTEVADAIWLDDEALLDVPFLLLTAAAPFTFTESEARTLGRYLAGGGFLYAEAVGIPRREGNGYATDLRSLRELVETALSLSGLARGKDWHYRRLPDAHPVYHSFHDMPGLPMGFWDTTENSAFTTGQDAVWSPDYLEGIEVGGDLVGIYSQKDYCDYWGGAAERIREGVEPWSYPSRVDVGGEEIPVYRLGVNILVYALTREGSLAEKVVAE